MCSSDLGTLCHWTAGPKTGDRPSLNICVNGRSDLSGPLCQVFLTRAGKPVIVAAGRANHAGPGGYAGVRGNSGWYGIEAESSGGADWTDAQRRNYPRLVAAMQRGLGRTETTVAGHSEYAEPHGRKVDINGYPMSAMRSAVATHLAGGPTISLPEQDTDMDANQAQQLADLHRTFGPDGDVAALLGVISARAGAAEIQTRDISGQVWARGLYGLNGYAKDGSPTFGDVAAGVRLANADAKTDSRNVAALVAGSVAQVLASLPDDVDVDPAVIEAAATEGALAGVRQALREVVTVEVSVKGSKDAA